MIELLLRDYYPQAAWSEATSAYAKRHGLNMDIAPIYAGEMAILPCAFSDSGFWFDANGEPAVIIECLAEDCETTIDLCAWPVNEPKRFATALGTADALGIGAVTNPASWAFGCSLQMHRCPLDWLRTGCSGAVILDHRYVAIWLGEALGPIIAEDFEHGENLWQMLNPRFPRSRILIPAKAEIAA